MRDIIKLLNELAEDYLVLAERFGSSNVRSADQQRQERLVKTYQFWAHTLSTAAWLLNAEFPNEVQKSAESIDEVVISPENERRANAIVNMINHELDTMAMARWPAVKKAIADKLLATLQET